MKKKTRKRAITLIEMMIVILLIGIIGGALAFNMKGSLDQGKAFKTEQNQERIAEILRLEYASGEYSLDQIAGEWKQIVKRSPLVKGKEILRDGWNEEFIVKALPREDDFSVESAKYKKFQNEHKKGQKEKE